MEEIKDISRNKRKKFPLKYRLLAIYFIYCNHALTFQFNRSGWPHNACALRSPPEDMNTKNNFYVIATNYKKKMQLPIYLYLIHYLSAPWRKEEQHIYPMQQQDFTEEHCLCKFHFFYEKKMYLPIYMYLTQYLSSPRCREEQAFLSNETARLYCNFWYIQFIYSNLQTLLNAKIHSKTNS